MRQAGLSDSVIAFLQAQPQKRFEDHEACTAHLDNLGISRRNAVKLASEAQG